MHPRLVGPLILCLVLTAQTARAYRLEGARWPNSALPIVWYLDADGTTSLGPNATKASVRQAVIDGFAAWHNVSGVKISFNAPIDLPAAQRNAQLDTPTPLNKLYWVEAGEGWQYDSGTLGVTTPIWYQGSGDIIDADIEFNSRDFRWQTGPNNYIPCDTCADTLSIAVHEEGHFIGMAHSCEINEIQANRCGATATAAVMLAAYDGRPKQVLQPDDIAGVRALYPAPNPGSGLQGYACTQDVDCANPLKCRNAQGGGNKVCTPACAAGGASCPTGLSCIAANTGLACLPPADSVGDLCHSCASGSGCSSGQCVQTAEFAYCSRACSPTTACPGSGYVCIGVQGNQAAQCAAGMTGCFCFPQSQTCANNCDASNPCPTGQQCTAGSCKHAPGADGQPCSGTQACGAGLVCAGSSATDATCHRTCSTTAANSCPGGQECAQLSGGATPDGACFAPPQGTAGEGEACASANCVAGLLCVGSSATDATCRRECSPATPSCPSGQSCAALSSGSGACVPGVVDPPVRAQECQPCGNGVSCDTGLFCVAAAGGAVCRKGCASQSSCSGPASCEAKAGVPGFTGVCSCGTVPPVGQPEAGPCGSDADCRSALMCVADHTQAVGACRTPCTSDGQCSPTQACTAVGAAHVCEARPADPGDPGRNATPPCGCASGGPGLLASLLGLAGVLRRRKAR